MRGWHELCYFRCMKRLIPLVLLVVVGCKKETASKARLELTASCWDCVLEQRVGDAYFTDTLSGRYEWSSIVDVGTHVSFTARPINLNDSANTLSATVDGWVKGFEFMQPLDSASLARSVVIDLRVPLLDKYGNDQ